MASADPATPPVRLALPLEYQQDLFKEIRSDDVLVILAHGLGLICVVTNLLHFYNATGNNLIILVGADERENSWIGEALVEHAASSKLVIKKGLTVINTDVTNVGAREKMYTQGGIFSITSRILVVDLLSELLDAASITGMVLLHSERVVATSTEAFIVRIYRQKNKTGFLKAFSDQAGPFTRGFAPLATSLRNLFLQQPSIWPRFHLTVAKCLEVKKKAEVVEFEIPMTDSMRDIQNAILECVEVSISELRKSGTGLELDDWNIVSALDRDFDKDVKRQLDPIWHRVSFRTKQLVNDLTSLKNILHALLTNDSVTFNKHLDNIRAAYRPPPGSTRHEQSPWLFLDAANTMFKTAEQRVFTSQKRLEQTGAASVSGPEEAQLVLEEQPKWKLLAEILEEIENDAYFNPSIRDGSNGTILIMCSDQSTCGQIREYLDQMHQKQRPQSQAQGSSEHNQNLYSAEHMMRKKFGQYLAWKRQFERVNATLLEENKSTSDNYAAVKPGPLNRGKPPPNKRRRIRGGSAVASQASRTGKSAVDLDAEFSERAASMQIAHESTPKPHLIDHPGFPDDFSESEELFELFDIDDLIIVHQYDGDMDERLLEEVCPRYIIMYEPNAGFIRRVEVYRSSHTERNVRVYFIYYEGSVEEQRYLSAIRKEKDAFTRLIKERGNMALSLNHNASLPDLQDQFLRTVNTRIAGGGRLAATAASPMVVVDVREFRSSLPSLLHGRSMVIIPCTLLVADYVLSPTICVERKSIQDLIASLRSGRLFSQAETMLQHYKHPMLLIEFDQNKSFTLDTYGDRPNHSSLSLSHADIQSQLVMLTIAFPKLKVIWSSSPYQTAEIFEELKKLQDEPDPVKAATIGLEQETELGESSFNQTPHEMLRAVPGVTGKNINQITLAAENLRAVSSMTEDQLYPLVGDESGRQIHRFFNRSFFDE